MLNDARNFYFHRAYCHGVVTYSTEHQRDSSKNILIVLNKLFEDVKYRRFGRLTKTSYIYIVYM